MLAVAAPFVFWSPAARAGLMPGVVLLMTAQPGTPASLGILAAFVVLGPAILLLAPGERTPLPTASVVRRK